ncbi:hypothetical protein MMC27_005659 [Xylographa pallens]|nr:hypothetical protein [Xylographa pallens]
MSLPQEAQPPALTPQFCFHPTALQDFLRLSRATTDDPLSATLNALTPSAPFSPRSPTTPRPTRTSHRVPRATCTSYLSGALFPAWHARTKALTYCASVAISPDPNDPELLARQAEGMRDRERVVDERLDPYSGRFFPKEPRTEELARKVRAERGIEGIVRGRSWDVVGGKCEGGGAEGWEEAVAKWESGRARMWERV